MSRGISPLRLDSLANFEGVPIVWTFLAATGPSYRMPRGISPVEEGLGQGVVILLLAVVALQ